MRYIFAHRLLQVLQAVSITCNSFIQNATLPSCCSCISLHINFLNFVSSCRDKSNIYRKAAPATPVKGSLASRYWKGLKENFNCNIWAWNWCSHPSTQDGSCWHGSSQPAAGKLVRSEYPIYPVSLSLHSTHVGSDPAETLPFTQPPSLCRHPSMPGQDCHYYPCGSKPTEHPTCEAWAMKSF